MIATRIVHLEQNLVRIQFKKVWLPWQNQLLKILYLFRACHHFDVIEIVHLEQNLVWFEFEKVRLPWQEDCQISCLKSESLIFFESLPPFHVKKICLGMLVFRQNIYPNFTSLQCTESFTTDTTILHISSNAVVQCNVSGHGKRIPRESVFAKIPNLGGIFGRLISTHFCNWVPCQCFLFNRPLFLKEN